MGYVQTWSYQPGSQQYAAAWPQLVADTQKIIARVAELGITLRGPDGTGQPQANPRLGILFNGDAAAGLACDAFYLPAPHYVPGAPADCRVWRFVKTEGLPYDTAVCAALLRAHLLAPSTFLIGGSGVWEEDWTEPPRFNPRDIVGDLFGIWAEHSPLTDPSEGMAVGPGGWTDSRLVENPGDPMTHSHAHLSAEDVARRMRAIEERIQKHIDTTGWSVIVTHLDSDAGALPIAYTVGLTERDLPELCIVGIHPEDGTGVINDLAHRVMNGSPLRHGQRLGDVLDSFDVIAVEGPATGIIQPTIALHKYGPGAVRLQQIVWPDPDGRFPWDDGYNMPPAYQPVIANPGQTPPAAEHLLLTIDERRLLGPADWANAAALIQTWGPQVKVSVNIDVRQLLVHGLSALTPRQVAELADRLVILPADITF